MSAIQATSGMHAVKKGGVVSYKQYDCNSNTQFGQRQYLSAGRSFTEGMGMNERYQLRCGLRKERDAELNGYWSGTKGRYGLLQEHRGELVGECQYLNPNRRAYV